MTNWIARFSFKYRVAILLLAAGITVFMSFGLRYLDTTTKIDDMLPTGHSYIKLIKKFTPIFGGGNTVICEIKANNGDIFNAEFLRKLKRVTNQFRYNDYTYPLLVDSITLQKSKYITVRGGGEVHIDSLIWPRIPTVEAGLQKLKQNVMGSPLYNGALVSADGKAASIIAQFKPTVDYSKLHAFFSKLKQTENDDLATIHLTGRPVLLATIYSHWTKIFILFGVTFLFIAILLFVFLRCAIGVIVPLVVMIMSTLWGLGFAGYTHLNFAPLMVVLPFLVSIRCVSSAVQKCARYIEEEARTKRKDLAVQNTIASMFMPCVTAVSTDAAGFGVMMLSDIPFLRNISLLLTCWIINLIFLSGIVAPLLAYYLPSPKHRHRLKSRSSAHRKRKDRWKKINRSLAAFAIKPFGRRFIVVMVIAIAVLFGREAMKISVGEITPGSGILKADSPYNLDFAEITSRFDHIGPDTFTLFFEGQPGAVQYPEFLRYIEAFEFHMLEHLPDICGGNKSLTTIIRQTNSMFHEGDPAWGLIPNQKKATGDLLLLYRQKQPPGGFDCFSDRLFRYGNTVLFFKNHTSTTIKRIEAEMRRFFDKHPPELKGLGVFEPAGGVIGVHAAVNDSLRKDHLKVDLAILCAVFVICAICFRSFLIAVFIIIPLAVANLVGVGLMSLMGLSLTIESIPITAVGVAIGVDFSIYLHSRYREEFFKCGEVETSLVNGAMSVGRTILFIALVMIIPLCVWGILADIRFQSQMGLFYALIFFVNLLFALVFQPAIVTIFGKRINKQLRRA
jgi:predicted RND superfamily exporter protein